MARSLFDRFSWLSTALLTLGMLIPGTINTLSKKAQNETLSIGLNGVLEPFNHPWFQTLYVLRGCAHTGRRSPFFFLSA